MCELNINGYILYRILGISISFIFTVFFGSFLINIIKNIIKETRYKNNTVIKILISNLCALCFTLIPFIIFLLLFIDSIGLVKIRIT